MLANLKDKWYLKILLIGVLIRLVLMPITLHPDLWGHSLTVYFFAYKGVINIYDFLLSLPATHPLVANFGVADIFIYPPLTYFTLGFFRLLIKPFTDPSFLPFVMQYPSLVYERADLFWNLFLYKLPYLFVDIGTAFLLANLFNQNNQKRLAFALWMFNPLALYSTFMVGQLDILPTFFTVLALFFASRKKYALSVIALGIGGGYKMYPLLLLVPAAFVFGKSIISRLKYLFIGLAPFVITIAPFIFSPAFRYMVFSPKASKMLFMGWNVSGAEVVYPFILFLTLIYAASYYLKKQISAAVYFLVVLLVTFSVTHYHPQWFVWITPFFVWQLVEYKGRFWELVAAMFGCWFTIMLFFEASLSFGLFNPLNPNLNNAHGLSELLGNYTNVFQLKSIVRSIFAGASIFYIYQLFKAEIQKVKTV